MSWKKNKHKSTIGYSTSYSSSYVNKSKSSYSYGYDDDYYGGSTWNWGSFGSGYYGSSFEDKDDNLYIKGSESYFTPKSADISLKVKYQVDTKANRDLIKEMSRYFYHKMMDDKDYFDEKYSDETRLTDTQISELGMKKIFYEELWDKFIPGFSPLEKALAIFDQLNEKHKSEKKEYSTADLVEAASSIKFDDEVYMDPVYNELLDSNHFSKAHKISVLNKLSMVKNLGSEFKIEKEVEEKRVANSHIVSKKLMRDYSELHHVELYQRLMPTFNLKLLTKELIVNVPVDRTEHKQKIIMLLDYSGSMNDPRKQEWVVAILVDRLRHAMKEEAEIFFSYFINDKRQMSFHHLYDRESVLKFWSSFSTSPSGGDTCLGDMVNYIKDEIEVNHKLHNLNIDLSKDKPEILAINDGQDSIKTKQFTYKTNAVSLIDSQNEELKGLCLKNDGKYVFIGSGGEVTTFNKGGKQVLTNK